MADNTGSAHGAGAVVARDTERFKLLFKNGRPEISADYKAPLSMKLTRAVIGDRSRAA
ncbi:hypothetical protein MKL09_09840 [Methylobacterium sp. J-048]|uniref:hypothetical protein n=1 Tax=Methylobacterium sp. J-048 TaxID=2836635 RepID=UPI001FB9BD05|nr:hypothetical protein [Methylobacterium sp. J-048]MCJ2056855.1 hypothetical protein [Methylobacterium sp. J-048]